jgi:hypothetical protein
MPDTYTGSATGSHSPSPTPDFAHDVEVQIPLDGERFNSSAFAQAPEVLADWIEFLRGVLSAAKGVWQWDQSTTYAQYALVIDPSDGHLYWSRQAANVGHAPHSSTYYWWRIDYTNSDIQDLAASVVRAFSGVSCSHGASVAEIHQVTFGGGLTRHISFSVQNVPTNSYTDVDLRSCDAKLTDRFVSAQVSLGSGGYSYGGEVGYNPNISDSPNIIRIWHKKTSGGDPATAVNVSVTIVGV